MLSLFNNLCATLSLDFRFLDCLIIHLIYYAFIFCVFRFMVFAVHIESYFIALIAK